MATYIGKTIYVKRPERTIAYPTICFSYFSETSLHGIFYEDHNSIKHIFPVLMAQIFLSSVLSKLIYLILKPLKQPKVVSQILAGIILGPSGLGRNKAFRETFFAPKELLILNTFVVIGVTLYVFLTAVKMDTHELLRKAKNSWSIGISAFIVPLIISQFVSSSTDKYLDNCFGGMNAFFRNVGLNLSYFPAIANILEEQNLLTTELGQLAMSISMLLEISTEVLTEIFIFIFNTVFSKDLMSAIETLLLTCVIVVFAIMVVRPVILQIIKRKPDGEPIKSFYVIALILCALFGAVLSDIFLGSYIQGVVLVGLVIPDGPPLGSLIVEKSELIVSELFLPLFFVQIGFHADLRSITDFEALSAFLLKLVVLHSSKILATVLASSCFHIKLKNAILLGCILNFKGVQDLVLYARWLDDTVLLKQCYTILVLFTLILDGIFCPLVRLVYKPDRRLTKAFYDEGFTLETLQSVPNNFELRVLSCVYDEDNVHSMITILNSLKSEEESSSVCCFVTHLVDLVGRTVPLLIPYKKSKKRSMPHNSHHIIQAFQNFASESQGSITIQPFIAIAPIKSIHNIICNLAQDRHIPFIIVPFNDSKQVQRIQHSIRNFNSMLQERAHCTVGILVDRGSHVIIRSTIESHFCVAVIFIGGPDDREALALVNRMSVNPQVRITMFRIITREEENVGEWEKEVDEYLVKDFIERNSGNAYVSYSEMVANNGMEMMDVIRSMEKNFNLIIVGNSPRRSEFEKEMATWIDYPELGVIGDALASTDFKDSNMSVLVIKHSDVKNNDGSTHYAYSQTSSRCNSHVSLR